MKWNTLTVVTNVTITTPDTIAIESWRWGN